MLDEHEQLHERVTQPPETIEGTGTYVLRDGKLVKGEAEKQVRVDYSNWHAGNVDPEDLKR